MGISIGKPKISRRPDILDNGKQRINPETNKPVWIPQVCVKLENDGAADQAVCVTIYRIRRRGKKKNLEAACTKKVNLPKIVVLPLGTSKTIVEVCCDLDFPPEIGAEFIAAWEAAGAGDCGNVKLKKNNRSEKLRVQEVLLLCMYPGDTVKYAMLVGLGLEDMEIEAPEVHIAANLPIGWHLDLPEEPPVEFPALIPFSLTASEASYADEIAEIEFRVVDKDGVLLDDDACRFAIVPNPNRPECIEPEA